MSVGDPGFTSQISPARVTLGDRAVWRLTADLSGAARPGTFAQSPADSSLEIVPIEPPSSSRREGGTRWSASLEVRGFDIAWAPKSKLFGRGKGPRLLGRFVPRVDRDAVVDAWTQAGKTSGSGNEEMCVLLMGSAVAPAGELALAIAEQRRRQRGAKLTLIPVDARNWDAHMPVDAPGIAKTLLARLRTGS